MEEGRQAFKAYHAECCERVAEVPSDDVILDWFRDKDRPGAHLVQAGLPPAVRCGCIGLAHCATRDDSSCTYNDDLAAQSNEVHL